jgi:acyl dehydratase
MMRIGFTGQGACAEAPADTTARTPSSAASAGIVRPPTYNRFKFHSPSIPDAMSSYYEDFTVGARYPTYSRTITEGDHSLFCALVGYHVPLFIDEEYARTTQYGSRICPSHLIMSFSTGMTESMFRTSVVGLLALDGGRFFAPVRIGDTIRTEVEVISKRETSKPDRGLVVLRDLVYNQRDELVFQMDKTALIRMRASV